MEPMNPLCELSRVLRALEPLLEPAASRHRGRTGAFSFVEHVWHLADLEVEGHGARIRRLLEEDEPLLPDFDGGRMARERGYLSLDVATGLARFEQARAANLRVLVAASATQLSRGGVQEGVGRILLRDLPVKMLAHDCSHARELLELLEDVLPGGPVPPSLRALADAPQVPLLSPCARRQLRVHDRPDEAGMLPLGRLRQLLRSWDAPRPPKMEELAAALHMSGRTLQRRLALRGMTFQCLLDEVRAGLALEYVRAPGAALPDIASRLGYSELRAFLRAFKRWTGLSPVGFRRAGQLARPC